MVRGNSIKDIRFCYVEAGCDLLMDESLIGNYQEIANCLFYTLPNIPKIIGIHSSDYKKLRYRWRKSLGSKPDFSAERRSLVLKVQEQLKFLEDLEAIYGDREVPGLFATPIPSVTICYSCWLEKVAAFFGLLSYYIATNQAVVSIDVDLKSEIFPPLSVYAEAEREKVVNWVDKLFPQDVKWRENYIESVANAWFSLIKRL